MSLSTQPTKFGGSNFNEWFHAMEEHLREKKVWKYVAGREPLPAEEDYKKDAEEKRRFKKDTGTWYTEDEAAMGIIGGGLEEWLKKEVRDLSTSKERWDYLVTKYKPAENLLSTVEDWNEVFSRKFDGTSKEALMSHFNTLMNFNGRLGELALTDAALAITMINSLPVTTTGLHVLPGVTCKGRR